MINIVNPCIPIKITPTTNKSKSDNLNILVTRVNGRFSEIKMAFGGCNENTNHFQLTNTSKLLSTYGPPVYAALQYCKAYFERETGYDISILTNNKKTNCLFKVGRL